jgi:hypothetical protein
MVLPGSHYLKDFNAVIDQLQKGNEEFQAEHPPFGTRYSNLYGEGTSGAGVFGDPASGAMHGFRRISATTSTPFNLRPRAHLRATSLGATERKTLRRRP